MDNQFNPQHQQVMKNINKLTLLFISCAVVSACGGEGDSSTSLPSTHQSDSSAHTPLLNTNVRDYDGLISASSNLDKHPATEFIKIADDQLIMVSGLTKPHPSIYYLDQTVPNLKKQEWSLSTADNLIENDGTYKVSFLKENKAGTEYLLNLELGKTDKIIPQQHDILKLLGLPVMPVYRPHHAAVLVSNQYATNNDTSYAETAFNYEKRTIYYNQLTISGTERNKPVQLGNTFSWELSNYYSQSCKIDGEVTAPWNTVVVPVSIQLNCKNGTKGQFKGYAYLSPSNERLSLIAKNNATSGFNQIYIALPLKK